MDSRKESTPNGGADAFGGGGGGTRGSNNMTLPRHVPYPALHPNLPSLGSSSMVLRVEPADMEQKAMRVNAGAKKLRQQYDELERALLCSQSYWNGEAAEMNRKAVRALRPALDEMLALLEGHAQNLTEIARVYRQAEAKVEGGISALPNDALK